MFFYFGGFGKREVYSFIIYKRKVTLNKTVFIHKCINSFSMAKLYEITNVGLKD